MDRSCVNRAAVPPKNGPEKNSELVLVVRERSPPTTVAPRFHWPLAATWRVRSAVSRAKLRTEIGAWVQVTRSTSLVPGNRTTLAASKVFDAPTLIW